jgi:hypothetical protein
MGSGDRLVGGLLLCTLDAKTVDVSLGVEELQDMTSNEEALGSGYKYICASDDGGGFRYSGPTIG